MPSFTAREVRTWAREHDVDCPGTGKVPQRVIDAYLLDVHGTTADPGDQDHATEPDTDSQTDTDSPGFSVTVTIPGADDMDIAQHIVEALWSVFEAGRAAERERILGALGGAA